MDMIHLSMVNPVLKLFDSMSNIRLFMLPKWRRQFVSSVNGVVHVLHQEDKGVLIIRNSNLLEALRSFECILP